MARRAETAHPNYVLISPLEEQPRIAAPRKNRAILWAVLMLVKIFVLVLYFSFRKGNSQKYFTQTTNIDEDDSRVPCVKCEPNVCTKARDVILQFVDQHKDPCEDFYDFVCGKYRNSTLDVYNATTLLETIQGKFENRLREIVTSDLDNTEDHGTKLMKRYYKACVDANKDLERYKRDLSKSLQDIIGGSKDTEFNWWTAYVKSIKSGVALNYVFEITQSDDNITGNNLVSILPLCTKQYYSLADTKNDKIELIRNVMGYFYRNISEEDAVDMLAYEDNLLQHMCTRLQFVIEPERFEGRIQEYTIKQLQRSEPWIPWKKMLSQILNVPIIKNSYKIQMGMFENSTSFSTFYNITNNTDKRIQVNYFLWRILSTNLEYAPDGILKQIHSQWVSRALTDKCYEIATIRFSGVEKYRYIQETIDQDKRNKVKVIIDYIKREYYNYIDSITWMELWVKMKARAKLMSMDYTLGFSDLDELTVQKALYVYGFNFQTQSFLQMDQEWLRTYYRRYYEEFYDNTPRLKIKRILLKYTTTNAFFVSMANSMILPAPLLQDDIIFNKNYPMTFNFGTLGRIISHEIMHGLQESGRYFMLKNFTVYDWWGKFTPYLYSSVVSCVKKDYERFMKDEHQLRVNGSVTLEENVADFVSTDITYRAYRKWIVNGCEEESLPNLPYSANQLFWIHSNIWLCEKNVENIKLQKILTALLSDVQDHAAGRFRVNAATKNSLYFAKDFGCSLNSRMNPLKKCRVYK